MMSRRGSVRAAGFSMVELVTVIVITGILGIGLANLLRHPMNGFVAVSRRAELVAIADGTMSRMVRDLRRALPNSVRVAGGGSTLEFLHILDGGRYRREPGINNEGAGPPSEEDHTASSDWLSFGDDASFNVLGRFQDLGLASGTLLPAGTRIAIYPTGSGIWDEAAAGSSPATITPAGTSITFVVDGDEDQLQLDADHRFSLESPSRRLYLVDTPITYLCDVPGEALWRVVNYAAAATQPTSLAAAPLASGSSARAADRVESCAFDYRPGTPTRAGLVTIEIVLASAGERVRLLQQVQVQNAP